MRPKAYPSIPPPSGWGGGRGKSGARPAPPGRGGAPWRGRMHQLFFVAGPPTGKTFGGDGERERAGKGGVLVVWLSLIGCERRARQGPGGGRGEGAKRFLPPASGWCGGTE